METTNFNSEYSTSDILNRLHDIEIYKDVTILFACEGGSRAYGLEHSNSDYDVRFIYYHSYDKYLSLETPPDIIKPHIVDKLDIEGWDVKKFLHLLYFSNLNPFDWLKSPVVYSQETSFINKLNEIKNDYYDPYRISKHYSSLSYNNYFKYIADYQNVTYKRYCYVLRGIFSCIHLEKFPGKDLPINFYELYDNIRKFLKLDCFDEFLKVIDTSGPAIEELNNFIKDNLNNKYNIERNHVVKNMDDLNKLFISIFYGIRIM